MIILAHGGAGTEETSGKKEKLHQANLRLALQQGARKKSAHQAVLSVVQALEDDPIWNAGRGAVLAEDGQPYLDASLALSDGRSGAVGNILLAESAIASADLVLQRSPHSLLTGREADSWIAANGGQISSPESRTTVQQTKLWKEWKQGKPGCSLGTVGAVALDQNGHLAAGTSTGGLRGKDPGRVGDSAIIGAGTWCSSECAISMTGDGDVILARSSAARIALDIERGRGPRKSINRELCWLLEEGAPAGCIVLLRSGKSWMMRNCPVLHRGSSKRGKIKVPRASRGSFPGPKKL